MAPKVYTIKVYKDIRGSVKWFLSAKLFFNLLKFSWRTEISKIYR